MGLPNDHVGAAVFLASSDSDFRRRADAQRRRRQLDELTTSP
jgi:hypothetical protein